MGIRLPVEEEILGADFSEHGTIFTNIMMVVEDGLLKIGVDQRTIDKFLSQVICAVAQMKKWKTITCPSF